MDNKVWLILRPHYSPLGVMESIGICGTGFFINKNLFISSYHVLNESSFIPNAHYANKNIFLINSQGQKLEITQSNICKSFLEIDVIFIEIKQSQDYFEIEENYLEGDEIRNIGYPSKNIEEILKDFSIKKQFNTTGKILKICDNYSINANDVKISNKKIIILNYSSEIGLSGGPLLKGNKVIGIMSHLYPQDGNAIAISMKEIKTFSKFSRICQFFKL